MKAALFYFCVFIKIFKSDSYDFIEDYTSPDSCLLTSEADPPIFNETRSKYFDSLYHKCKQCAAHQTTSEDRLSCQCQPGYKIWFNEKSKNFECAKCDQVLQPEICMKESHQCDSSYDIKVLQVTGNNETTIRCLTCPVWHQPDVTKSTCIPCLTMCHCPIEYVDVKGTCVRKNDIIPDSPTLYTLNFQGKYYSSSYMKTWVQPVASKCKAAGGGKSCEQLANLCVMNDYNFDSQTGCSIYRQLSISLFTLPPIYYDEGRNNHLLNVERINIQKNQRIEFVVKRYGIDGSYQLIQPLESVFASLCCTSSWGPVQRNANNRESCSLHSKHFTTADMHFYELYLVDRNAVQSRLINIPIRVLSFTRGGIERNKVGDISRWQLTKRFFNIDVATGSSQEGGNPDFIRYLSSFTIRMSVVPNQVPLAIKVPYATVNYEIIGNFDKEKLPIIKFAVENIVNMDDAMKSVEIALSVLSSFAALYVFVVRIIVWYQREDKTTIDLMTLIRLLIYGADILANVIFTVVFLASFYWFITFRQQDEVNISLPESRDEQFIKDLVISAFTLKAISVLWLIYEQCTISIFFIDWENPKPSKTDDTVSVWRTYFVANEWNELQVARKSSLSLQIVAVLLLLCVFKLERFALENPSSYYKADAFHEYNTILRLALGCSTYLAILIVQNLWNALITERYIENKIHRFTDLCTLSNISVWLLVHPRYGFYIHGRSPHGFSDTDMQSMLLQLKREEENLCAQRGLIQGQDIQTFSMSLHRVLIDKWSKLQASPIINSLTANSTSTAFNTVNQFLTSFLDHALSDMDYEVRDRHIAEVILDMEMWTKRPADRTVFYNDARNSFTSVLFYGQEETLALFDLLLFSLVDMYAHNYVAAGITTFIIFKVLQFIRYRFGQRNIARKTLIDSRFLF